MKAIHPTAGNVYRALTRLQLARSRPTHHTRPDQNPLQRQKDSSWGLCAKAGGRGLTSSGGLWRHRMRTDDSGISSTFAPVQEAAIFGLAWCLPSNHTSYSAHLRRHHEYKMNLAE